MHGFVALKRPGISGFHMRDEPEFSVFFHNNIKRLSDGARIQVKRPAIGFNLGLKRLQRTAQKGPLAVAGVGQAPVVRLHDVER